MFEIEHNGLRAPDCGDNCKQGELWFHPFREWRFDYAWIKERIALEIEGGVRGSRHFSLAGFQDDQVKYLEADILGWRVVHVNYKMLENGVALDLLKGAFRSRNADKKRKAVPQVYTIPPVAWHKTARARKGQSYLPKVRRKRKAGK